VSLRIVMILLAAAAAGCGPSETLGPEASGPPVTDTADNGHFRLAIGLASGLQHAGAEIQVRTQLTYLGQVASVVVGSNWSPPVYFQLEHLDGNRDMTDVVSLLMCERTPLNSGVAIDVPFVKSGGFGEDDPDAEYWRTFLNDPQLRLPAGHWRVSAHFQGTLDDECRGPAQTLSAEVTFLVVP